MGDGDLGLGDWGWGPTPNPQSPIPNPQSPIPIPMNLIRYKLKNKYSNNNIYIKKLLIFKMLLFILKIKKYI